MNHSQYVAHQRAKEGRWAVESAEKQGIEKGAVVVVARGRKVPKGTLGEVFWVGADSYGNARCGLKTREGVTHWTATSNCDVVAPAAEKVPFVPAPGFTRGAEVMTPQGPGKVFWVGECRKTPGATRVGVKTPMGSEFFAATECTTVEEEVAA